MGMNSTAPTPDHHTPPAATPGSARDPGGTPSALPPPLADRPFTAAEALTAGITARTLAGRRFVRLFRDVYATRAVAAMPWARPAGALLVAPHAVLGHASAASLWGLPLPAHLTGAAEPVHLIVPPGGRIPRRAGICVHEVAVPATDIAPLGPLAGTPLPLRVAVPARVLLDVSDGWTVADVVALADAAVARHLLDIQEIYERVAAAAGRRGVTTLRRAVPLVDASSPNAVSSRVRVLLMAAGLPRPRHLDGAHLCWSTYGVVVDVDAWALVSRPERIVLRAWDQLRDAGWSPGSQRPAVQAALAAVGAFRAARWGLGEPA